MLMSYRIPTLLTFLIFCLNGLNAQNTYRFQLNNGLEVFMVKDSTHEDYFVSLAVKGGQIFDRCGRQGTSYVMEQLPLSGNTVHSDASSYELLQRTIFPDLKSFNKAEHIRYQGTTKSPVSGAQFLKEIILFPSFSPQAREVAVARANQKIAKLSLDDDFFAEKTLWNRVFSESRCPINIYPDTVLKASDFSLDSLNRLYEKYYRPDRALLTVQGPFEDVNKLKQDLGNIFIDWTVETENPFIEIPSVYRTNAMINHNQEIRFRDGDEIDYYLAFQGPSLDDNFDLVLPARVFGNMLTEIGSYPNNPVSEYPFDVFISPHQYTHLIYLHWSLSPEEAGPFLSDSKSIWDKLGDELLFTERQFDRGKESIVNELKIEKADRESINQLLNNAWSAANILYFLSIQDILEQVDFELLIDFQKRYIQNAFPYEFLETSDSVYSEIELDTVMVETTEQLAKIQFEFDENEAEITEDQIPQLFAIRQYLINNPHILIQVNGFADKSEYLKVNDPSLENMIKKFPRFQKVERNLINKDYIRLDMARSLYVIEYFLQGGIAPHRISGTSSLYKSKYKERRYMNRKVTFSYDLIRSERYMRLINEQTRN